jgi:hypothetical protein
VKANTAAFVLAVLLMGIVAFWVGVLVANIFPGLLMEPLELLIDTAAAIGTIGAVVVALWQLHRSKRLMC